MRQPTKPKPQAFEEVARVLNVYRMLEEELRGGEKYPDDMAFLPPAGAILTVAERIAARTEG